ncbi:MAG: 50S ribosomal protein L32 [bacterium]
MNPPQRISYGRTRRRRAHHALTGVTPGLDPVSGMPKMHHRVSIQSGYVRPGLTIQVAKLGIGAPKKRKKLGDEGGGN